jgi:hypothetical protein
MDRLGEDLGAPARLSQDVAQLEGVGAGCVVRVQRGEELVDGHRPPGGGDHLVPGSCCSYGVSPLRTAVMR